MRVLFYISFATIPLLTMKNSTPKMSADEKLHTMRLWMANIKRLSEPSVDAQRAIGGFRQELREVLLHCDEQQRGPINEILQKLAEEEARIMGAQPTASSSA